MQAAVQFRTNCLRRTSLSYLFQISSVMFTDRQKEGKGISDLDVQDTLLKLEVTAGQFLVLGDCQMAAYVYVTIGKYWYLVANQDVGSQCGKYLNLVSAISKCEFKYFVYLQEQTGGSR